MNRGGPANWILFFFTIAVAFVGVYYFINLTGKEAQRLVAATLSIPVPESKMHKTTDGNMAVNSGVVVLKTNYGEIEIKLSSESAPNTVSNFIKLAEAGFYNGTKFHRVIKGFMIQGGDPLSRDENMRSRWGTGGPGYKFDDELTGNEKYPQGTFAMANSGPDTNGSQFFIVTANPGVGLPPSYTVFGKVIKGMEVALAIESVKTQSNDQPVKDVILEKVTVN